MRSHSLGGFIITLLARHEFEFEFIFHFVEHHASIHIFGKRGDKLGAEEMFDYFYVIRLRHFVLVRFVVISLEIS